MNAGAGPTTRPADPAGTRLAIAAVAGAGALAAVVLIVWQLSPERRLLGHASRGAAPAGAAMLAWFTVSWLLMAAATMLPTSIPLVHAFARVVDGRADALCLVAKMVVGYLAVWTAAGLVLATFDVGLHTLADHTPLGDHTWVILAATLAIAGGYQMSAHSNRCLRACRSPFSFLAPRWSGGPSAGTQATVIGIDYGMSCLGCCASLMLLMFAVGMTSPLVMIGLGGVAAAHKLAPWGPAVARVTGWVLLAAGLSVVAVHLARVR